MLAPSREQSQTIVIGDNIELTVVAVQGGRIKLGIAAPRNVPIRRSELAALLASDITVARPTDDLAWFVQERINLRLKG